MIKIRSSAKVIWNKWLSFSHKVGNFNARIILSLFYFLFVTPLAIGVKLFSDPLRVKKKTSSYWIEKEQKRQGIEEAKRQF